MARFDWFGDELHGGFAGQAASFLNVADCAATDNIVPGGLPTAAAGNDVIEAKLAGGETLAAVLAAVVIAGVDVSAIELDLQAWQAVVEEQANDAGDGDRQADSVDPIVAIGLETPSQL